MKELSNFRIDKFFCQSVFAVVVVVVLVFGFGGGFFGLFCFSGIFLSCLRVFTYPEFMNSLS